MIRCMKLIQQPSLSTETECSYIPGKKWRFEFFFAKDLSGPDLNGLLKTGWRKFGMYYFRPYCDGCGSCVPIRVRAAEFTPSKSQRRTVRKCAGVRAEFGPLSLRDEIFEIYRDHSESRFGMKVDEDDFIMSFYVESCPSIQSEYYIEDRLAAVGFLDVSDEALSSVYFIYRSEYSKLGLGTYSVIRETEYAGELGLRYYYLGYWVRECGRMRYKYGFRPHDLYRWDTGEWVED